MKKTILLSSLILLSNCQEKTEAFISNETFSLPNGFQYLQGNDCAVKIDFHAQWSGYCENQYATGQGTLSFTKNGDNYQIEGNMEQGEFQGNTLIYKNGQQYYEGTLQNLSWYDNRLSFAGNGKLITRENAYFQGEIEYGLPNGWGSQYENHEETQRGKFINNKLDKLEGIIAEMKNYAKQVVNNHFDGGENIDIYPNKIITNQDGTFEYDFKITFSGNLISSNFYEISVKITDNLIPNIYHQNQTAQDYSDLKNYSSQGIKLIQAGQEINKLLNDNQ